MRILNKISFNEFINHLFLILEKSGTAAAVAGQDFSILNCNNIFSNLLSAKSAHNGIKLKNLFKNDLKDKYNIMLKNLNKSGYWHTNTVIAKRKKKVYTNISFIEIKDLTEDSLYTLIIINDISDYKEREIQLKSLSENLDKKNKELIESVSDLKEVIIQTELEKRHIQNNITENISKLIIPMLKNLKRICSNDNNKTAYIDSIEKALININSSVSERFLSDYEKLSPREIEICNMIKKNLSNKEIADLLYISILTVERHRHNIRKKLGIAKKKMNLYSYLNQE